MEFEKRSHQQKKTVKKQLFQLKYDRKDHKMIEVILIMIYNVSNQGVDESERKT